MRFLSYQGMRRSCFVDKSMGERCTNSVLFETLTSFFFCRIVYITSEELEVVFFYVCGVIKKYYSALVEL